MSAHHRTVEANGVQFAYLEAGPSDGPLALCLHGFPDTAHTWRHLLPQLADAGFHAVAPWMRGYSPTAVPADGRYQTGALVADAVALHEALGGGEDAVVIGHDWGAVAAYGASAFASERWRRLVSLAIPPPSTFGSAIFTSYEQQKRSWYMFFFQTALADLVVPMNDLEFLANLWRDWSPGHDPEPEMTSVRQSLSQPENLEAALGYYRATFGSTPPDPALEAEQAATVQSPPQPCLYLHGQDDGCFGADPVKGAGDLLSPGSEVHVLDGVGHFLHLEKPNEVNDLILRFLAAP